MHMSITGHCFPCQQVLWLANAVWVALQMTGGSNGGSLTACLMLGMPCACQACGAGVGCKGSDRDAGGRDGQATGTVAFCVVKIYVWIFRAEYSAVVFVLHACAYWRSQVDECVTVI